MSLFGKDKDEPTKDMPRTHKGRFKFDDDVRKRIDDMSNTDELVEVMDLIGKNQESIEAAVEAVVALEKSGTFVVIQAMADGDLEQLDVSDRPRFVRNMHTLLIAANTVDDESLLRLVDQMPDTDDLVEDIENAPSFGPFAAVRSMNDPAVRRGLGKLIVLLRTLGQTGTET